MTEDLADKQKSERTALRDEDGTLRPDFIEAVEQAIAAGGAEKLRELASGLHEADLAALVEALPADSRPKLVELMGEDFDFAALTEVPDAMREEILEGLSPETVAEGVSELESDDAVELLEDLDRDEQAEILEAMPAQERVALRRSLDYPEKSAGRLMQTTVVAAPPTWTAGQTLDHLREGDQEELPDSFFEVFVVEGDRRFLGTVFLDVLARARRSAPLSEIMLADRRRVHVDENEEEVARRFERYNIVSAPVVDADDRLLGVITIDDIVDVIQEAADEDIKALGGVSRREEFGDPVISIARHRFVWLFVNLFTAFVASGVLSLFEVSLQKMVALAILAPIVASQGGNAARLQETVLMDVTSITNIGILAGALWVSAGKATTAKPLNGTQWAVALVAGLALGYSSRLAFGCNVGAMLSGISTGSIHGWIWVPLAFAGTIFGLRIRRHFGF